jgi:hypothetical protein
MLRASVVMASCESRDVTHSRSRTIPARTARVGGVEALGAVAALAVLTAAGTLLFARRDISR